MDALEFYDSAFSIVNGERYLRDSFKFVCMGSSVKIKLINLFDRVFFNYYFNLGYRIPFSGNRKYNFNSTPDQAFDFKLKPGFYFSNQIGISIAILKYKIVPKIRNNLVFMKC